MTGVPGTWLKLSSGWALMPLAKTREAVHDAADYVSRQGGGVVYLAAGDYDGTPPARTPEFRWDTSSGVRTACFRFGGLLHRVTIEREQLHGGIYTGWTIVTTEMFIYALRPQTTGVFEVPPVPAKKEAR